MQVLDRDLRVCWQTANPGQTGSAGADIHGPRAERFVLGPDPDCGVCGIPLLSIEHKLPLKCAVDLEPDFHLEGAILRQKAASNRPVSLGRRWTDEKHAEETEAYQLGQMMAALMKAVERAGGRSSA